LRETVLVENTSSSQQTTLVAEGHLAQRQFLLEKQNKENFIMYRARNRGPTVSRTEVQELGQVKLE
jgi:hypothetical protein